MSVCLSVILFKEKNSIQDPGLRYLLPQTDLPALAPAPDMFKLVQPAPHCAGTPQTYSPCSLYCQQTEGCHPTEMPSCCRTFRCGV